MEISPPIKQQNFTYYRLTGDQAALHDLIKTGKIHMNCLEHYNAEQLKNFCKDCKIPYSGRSQVNITLLIMVIGLSGVQFGL